MIVVVGSFRLPLERRDEVRAAITSVVVASRAESGCLNYAYAEDLVEPGLFRVSEAWTDRASLAAHFATSHMRRWQEQRVGFGMTERSVTAYHIDGEEQL